MSKTTKKNLSLQMAAIFTIAVLTIGTAQLALAKDDSRVKIEGEFAGIDDGKAKFESRDNGDRMKFSVEITDLAVVNSASYTIIVSSQTFSATAIGNVIELDLDSQCNDGPSDNNCWINPTELSGDVSVNGDGISTTAKLT